MFNCFFFISFIEEYNRLASQGNVPKEKLVAKAVAEIQNKGYFIGFKKVTKLFLKTQKMANHCFRPKMSLKKTVIFKGTATKICTIYQIKF